MRSVYTYHVGHKIQYKFYYCRSGTRDIYNMQEVVGPDFCLTKSKIDRVVAIDINDGCQPDRSSRTNMVETSDTNNGRFEMVQNK